MSRIIHTNSDIFFPNPKIYIKRDKAGISNVHRTLFKTVRNTWGFTDSYSDFSQINNAYEQSWVRYFCFSDDLDILQFVLTSGDTASRVYMWPAGIKFTIHEYLDETSNI